MSIEQTMTAFAATAEMFGKSFTDHQLILFAESVEKYDQQQFMAALRRVREECKFFSLAEVISRIDDGRPDPEEAWSLVRFGESETMVMNDDIGKAMGVARSAFEDGDKIGAKFAFKEKYAKVVAEARANAVRVKWFMSLGYDESGYAEPIKAALEAGRIDNKTAKEYLPLFDDGVVAGMLTSDKVVNSIPQPAQKFLTTLEHQA